MHRFHSRQPISPPPRLPGWESDGIYPGRVSGGFCWRIIVSKSLSEAGYQGSLHCVALYHCADRGANRRRTQLLIACKRIGYRDMPNMTGTVAVAPADYRLMVRAAICVPIHPAFRCPSPLHPPRELCHRRRASRQARGRCSDRGLLRGSGGRSLRSNGPTDAGTSPCISRKRRIEAMLRELVAQTRPARTSQTPSFSTRSKPGIGSRPASRTSSPSRPGASWCMASTIARGCPPTSSASRSRRRSPSAPAITAPRAAACCLLDHVLKARRPRRVLDLGTGTGVLAIAAAKALQSAVLASDIDPPSVAGRPRECTAQ